MPHLPLILAIIAAILIAAGRLGKRVPLALAGYLLLGVAAAVVVLGWSTA